MIAVGFEQAAENNVGGGWGHGGIREVVMIRF
jgi:hypothetical protein